MWTRPTNSRKSIWTRSFFRKREKMSKIWPNLSVRLPLSQLYSAERNQSQVKVNMVYESWHMTADRPDLLFFNARNCHSPTHANILLRFLRCFLGPTAEIFFAVCKSIFSVLWPSFDLVTLKVDSVVWEIYRLKKIHSNVKCLTTVYIPDFIFLAVRYSLDSYRISSCK